MVAMQAYELHYNMFMVHTWLKRHSPGYEVEAVPVLRHRKNAVGVYSPEQQSGKRETSHRSIRKIDMPTGNAYSRASGTVHLTAIA
jgi:hypothetical protein